MAQHLISIGLAGVQAFALSSQDRTGNALFSMSWVALTIPFTLIGTLAASKLFCPTEQTKNFPMGAKKLSTFDDFGDVGLRTAISIAALAPVILLSKAITSKAGYAHIKSIQQSTSSQVMGQGALILSGAIASHLLGCLFETIELTSKA